MNDAEMLLRWRNDPATRAASVNTDPVSPDDHVKWLSDVMNDPRQLLFIAEQNEPVGTVRIDLSDGDSRFHGELSWTVNPDYRGRGSGKEMVSRIARGHRLFARIKQDNHASQKIAEAAGFVLEEAGPLQMWTKRHP